MKNNRIWKLLPLLLILVLLGALAVSGVFAALTDSTAILENNFEPARVSAQIKDQNCVVNSGTAPCLVRVKLIVNWVDENGMLLVSPPEDASCKWTGGEGWTHIGNASDPADGYWYYNQPLPASYSTTPVLSDLTAQGGTLQIKLLAELVQAAPADAAASLWPEAVYQGGTWSAR